MTATLSMANLQPSPYAAFMHEGKVKVGDYDLHYEVGGPSDGEVILLVMGLGAQLVWWPEHLIEALIQAGYRVVRFDNRDIGLSGKYQGRIGQHNTVKMLARHALGLKNKNSPYTLFDMADDTVGLMDALGLERVHLVGASMGGMIAQIVAARYPSRVASLGLVFTSNSRLLLPPPGPAQMRAMFYRPQFRTKEDWIRHGARVMRTIGSSKYYNHDEMLAFARRNHERSHYPAGIVRQMMAVLGTGSLVEIDRKIRATTVVIHGGADKLLYPAHGRAVAKAIKGAQFVLIPEMGHDLIARFTPALSQALLENIARAKQSAVGQR